MFKIGVCIVYGLIMYSAYPVFAQYQLGQPIGLLEDTECRKEASEQAMPGDDMMTSQVLYQRCVDRKTAASYFNTKSADYMPYDTSLEAYSNVAPAAGNNYYAQPASPATDGW